VSVLFCLLSAMKVSAQYTITPVPPPPSFTFNDLWHFTVIRSSTDAYNQFYVSLRIFDGQSQLKVKSNTATLNLPAGTHYYNLGNISDLQPFVTSYYDGGFLQQVISTGGVFPAGTYNMVYTLYGKAADGEFEPLFEDNSQAIVDLMWPPILIWPEDGDTLPDPYPVLTWTPAYSSAYSGQILYQINMVAMLPGQTKEQAILSNPLFYTQRDLPATFLPYTAPYPELNENDTYAWQVTAHLGNVTANSQVWQFTFGPGTPLPSSYPPSLYAPLREKLDAGFHLAKNKILRIKYTEEYELPTQAYLLYNVYDEYGNKIRSSVPPSLNFVSASIKKGDNYITLSLGNSGLNLEVNKYYILEVMNYKNEKSYLRFKILMDISTPH